MAKFILFRSLANGEWRWHLKANNGEIICWAEGYSSESAARKSIMFVQTNAAKSPVE